MRRSRQAVYALAIAGLASAACVVLIFILASRDSGKVSQARGPGALEADHGRAHDRAAAATPPDAPPTSGPHLPRNVTRDGVALTNDQLLQALELGDVVLAYDPATPAAPLRRLQRAVSGPFDPELAAAGQMVVLEPRPGVHGVIALAWRRRVRAASAADPRLRAFSEAWLGRGAG
ncbi:MAG TPA: DUF3105 domain-containing protein [Solirubrobacteraceae bacterium]